MAVGDVEVCLESSVISKMMHALIVILLLQTASPRLTTLGTSQSDCLTVLLQLGNQLVSLLDHVVVLLILVVCSVRLNDLVDAVDCTWDSVGCDEIREVPIRKGC